MLTPAFLSESRRLIAAVKRDETLRDDEFRIASAFFGPVTKPIRPDASMLLWGARSGLEALIALRSNPQTQVYVIDSDAERRRHIDRVSRSTARTFACLADAIDGGLPSQLDFVRVDLGSFDAEELTQFLQSHDVGHLCGEVDDKWIDPLRLHRLCSDRTQSFYLYLARAAHPIAGYRNAHPSEVSVVVPVYNVEKYLDRCLESLAFQTIRHIEVIVIDDGSTDRSGAIADDWARRFPGRFRVIHKPNGGCASARMAGLAEAQGRYVGFVDGDDWVAEVMYEDLYGAAVLRNAEIAQCGFYEAHENGARIDHPTAWGGDRNDGNKGLVVDITSYLTLMPSIWRRIYSREFLLREKLEFPLHIRRHDDLAFAFPSLALARRVAVIPDCHYAYRMGRPEQDVAATDERLFVHFAIFDWMFAKIRPWATAPVLERLAELEVGTHRWVLSRLDRDLRRKYFRRALSEFRARYRGIPIRTRLRPLLLAYIAR